MLRWWGYHGKIHHQFMGFGTWKLGRKQKIGGLQIVRKMRFYVTRVGLKKKTGKANSKWMVWCSKSLHIWQFMAVLKQFGTRGWFSALPVIVDMAKICFPGALFKYCTCNVNPGWYDDFFRQLMRDVTAKHRLFTWFLKTNQHWCHHYNHDLVITNNPYNGFGIIMGLYWCHHW